MYTYNKLYGVLTNGDSQVRKSTESRANLSPDALRIVSALIPEGCSAPCTRALAELYIRLIESNKSISMKLDKYDSINSYKLHSFAEEFSDPAILETIVANVRVLGISGEDSSFLPLDYIVNALDKLLDELLV